MNWKRTLTIYETADGVVKWSNSVAPPAPGVCRFVSYAERESDVEGMLPRGQDWYEAYFQLFETDGELLAWLQGTAEEEPAIAEYLRQVRAAGR